MKSYHIVFYANRYSNEQQQLVKYKYLLNKLKILRTSKKRNTTEYYLRSMFLDLERNRFKTKQKIPGSKLYSKL